MTESEEPTCPPPGPRFVAAVEFARDSHGNQCRKGTPIPYISHLLAVASLVLEAGGDEDLAIAGLLHDTIEDTDKTEADISDAFGARVAEIVVACSDTTEKPKPPWRERKERYLEHLRTEASPDVLLVSRADKLHNARALLMDFRAEGDGFWTKFNAPPVEQRWYYNSLAAVFADRIPGRMTDELVRVVNDLDTALAQSFPAEP